MTENDKKQIMIIRQSQTKLILDYSVSIGKKISLKTMVGISQVLVDYVLNGYDKKMGDRLDKVDEYFKTL